MGEVLEVAAYMGHRTIGGWGPSKQEPMRDVGGLEEGGGGEGLGDGGLWGYRRPLGGGSRGGSI